MYDGILKLLTICQPIEAHCTTEMYFDSVEILVKVQNFVVLHCRKIVISYDRRKLDGLGFTY